MSKWIAEFELEDGDTMPERMDLEYRGARIDFHCKPLEQEPFINKPCISSGVCEHDKNVVLDKIRSEIIEKFGESECAEECGCLYELLEIIDKYKGESEE